MGWISKLHQTFPREKFKHNIPSCKRVPQKIPVLSLEIFLEWKQIPSPSRFPVLSDSLYFLQIPIPKIYILRVVINWTINTTEVFILTRQYYIYFFHYLPDPNWTKGLVRRNNISDCFLPIHLSPFGQLPFFLQRFDRDARTRRRVLAPLVHPRPSFTQWRGHLHLWIYQDGTE